MLFQTHHSSTMSRARTGVRFSKLAGVSALALALTILPPANAQASFLATVGSMCVAAPGACLGAAGAALGVVSSAIDFGTAVIGLSDDDTPSRANGVTRSDIAGLSSAQAQIRTRITTLEAQNAEILTDLAEISQALTTFESRTMRSLAEMRDRLSEIRTILLAMQQEMRDGFENTMAAIDRLPQRVAQEVAITALQVRVGSALRRARSLAGQASFAAREERLRQELALVQSDHQRAPDSAMAMAPPVVLDAQYVIADDAEALRQDIRKIAEDMSGVVDVVDWDNRAVTVDYSLMTNYRNLVGVYFSLYASELAMLHRNERDFSGDSHEVMVSQLEETLQTFKQASNWDGTTDTLEQAHREMRGRFIETLRGDAISSVRGQVLDGTSSVTVCARDAESLYAAKVTLTLTPGVLSDLSFVDVAPGTVVARYEDEASAVAGCVSVPEQRGGATQQAAVRDTAEAYAQAFQLNALYLKFLAVQHDLFRELEREHDHLSAELTQQRRTAQEEPFAVAERALRVDCSFREDPRLNSNGGSLVVELRVRPNGRLADVEVLERDGVSGSEGYLATRLQRSMRCGQYRPRQVNGEDVFIRQRVTIHL